MYLEETVDILRFHEVVVYERGEIDWSSSLYLEVTSCILISGMEYMLQARSFNEYNAGMKSNLVDMFNESFAWWLRLSVQLWISFPTIVRVTDKETETRAVI